ncbi:response regulator [Methylorubrum extorquens]
MRHQPAALVGIVTERQEAQKALEETRARFIQAQKMEAIGQLTGGVAHDFNNLLAVVLGNLSLARKRLPPDGKLRQLIENSIQAAERGATLTKRMLAFARRQELTRGPIDVPELVRGMAELLQRSISSNIPVSTQFPLQLPLAFADASQLELALLNLTVNARDAMPDGGMITIAAREQRIGGGEVASLAPGSYVCLSVTDTGTGMSEETLAKATEPFFTTKGIGKGTGLGLSMIHGFAEQSGGRLVLKSALGRGTTAELWLPAAEGDLLRGAGQAPAPDLPVLNPLTVLVVDDDPLVLMNTGAMLEDLGHKVLEATSGEQALRVLRRNEAIDLVVTDQMMPGMTGAQLIDAIRTEHTELPVILASGYAELPEEKLTGIVRLGKPFEQADLARACEKCAGGSAGRALPSKARLIPFRLLKAQRNHRPDAAFLL